MTKQEALKRLSVADHEFLDAAVCQDIAGAFGTTAHVYTTGSTQSPGNPKGLQLRDGLDRATGQCAAALAEQIAQHLEPEFRPWQTGRGFRLRTACAVIAKKLDKEKHP